jgi:hypothetical protein
MPATSPKPIFLALSSHLNTDLISGSFQEDFKLEIL